MKISLIIVESLDGFITQGSDANIYSWTSKQDTEFFFKKIEQAKLVIMSSNTYGVARHFIKHKNGRTRVVMTRTPEKYSNEEVPGFLEFTNSSPLEIVKKYETLGKKTAVHVGGAEITTQFLKEKLITEVYVTIEPVLFGEGGHVLSERLDVALELISVRKLNKKGTLLLKYKVVK